MIGDDPDTCSLDATLPLLHGDVEDLQFDEHSWVCNECYGCISDRFGGVHHIAPSDSTEG